MKIQVTYTPINVEKVVDATAEAPGVQAACAAMAGKVAGAAGVNLMSSAQPKSRSDQMLKEDALAGVGVKPVEEFLREGGEDLGGTIIPVALAVADDWSSFWWEFGTGRRIAATRFMRKALESAPVGSRWRRWVRP